ncbi:MAG: penicillin-binding protein 1C [Candidatus Goldbacteria bacterium]|nr:penicillin-binding protein 1C [Candidatus Goldiibacteriota bacterium]
MKKSTLLFRLKQYLLKPANKPALITAAAVLLPAAVWFLLNILFPLPLYRLQEDYSVLHITQENRLLRLGLSPSGMYRIKTPLSDMPEFIKRGIVEYEDKMFYLHRGINPFAVARAVFLNVTSMRVVSGGSTITMQLAKLIEPRKRTMGAKIIEAFRASQLEVNFSKKQILEMYLNNIPMGGNIEGVAAASYLYFNKAPINLTLPEAALLIALPKSPNSLRPDRSPQRAQKARDEVIQRIGGIFGEGIESAVSEPVSDKRYNNPYRLQHLVNKRIQNSGYVRKYFIDEALQSMCEYRLKFASRELKEYGVYNGAVIVVDNRTMNVAAYVGSPDFEDKEHCGEIDGVSIVRSPGSALKPFVYAMAAEHGMITPKKILYDIPRDYDGYSPVNSDRKFSGLVTAFDALSRSYNSTAVYLEYSLGANGLLGFLRKNGFYDIKRRDTNPGLAAALGAYPVSLEELVTMYAAIANYGLLRKLNFTDNGIKEKEEPVRVFSAGTAYMITQMLAEAVRPDLPQAWEFTHSRGKVAFKTGTSFGYGNAWCVGYNPDYTVGVWLGNADASPSFKLVGIKAAAPVVIEIFNYLTRSRDVWFAPPSDIGTRKICSVSGQPAGPNCKKTDEDIYIKGINTEPVCRVHKKIYVNKKTGLRADPGSFKNPDSAYRSYVAEIWPADIAAYLKERGQHLEAVPAYDPAEVSQNIMFKPKITSPENGGTYFITESLPEDFQKITLKASFASGVTGGIWLLNGNPVNKSATDEVLYISPKPGKYLLTVQDDTGASDSVSFKIMVKK